jgi:hypothetical protein
MQLRRVFAVPGLLACLAAPAAFAEEPPPGTIDADILVSYYDQDGDRSPVTGGIGTEKAEVVSPVILVAWQVDENLSLSADVGLDQISSASIGNIQTELSSASIPASDTRTFGTLKARRRFGSHAVGLLVGAAKEFDYSSFSYGIDWSWDPAEGNTTLAASARRYDDAIDLIGIDGEGSQGPGLPRTSGSADRTTTDLTLSLTQVLGRRTLASVELFSSLQEGMLATPYHEVILPGDVRVAERLPDSRRRNALGLRLHHAFADGLVARLALRYYTDDWGIDAATVELEPHFRLPSEREMWVYPILRYHTQSAADHFGEAASFTGSEEYFTSDGDLGETKTTKWGAGWSVQGKPGDRLFRVLDRFEMRATKYDRDDGLTGWTASFGFGWTF